MKVLLFALACCALPLAAAYATGEARKAAGTPTIEAEVGADLFGRVRGALFRAQERGVIAMSTAGAARPGSR